VVDRRYKDGKPIVLGGSLHRAPDGRLCTIQTTGVVGYPHPQGMQELWRNTSRKRYPIMWDGIEPTGALIVWWSEPFEVVCGRDRRSLGHYRAYNANREFGIVEITSREYVSSERFPDGPPGNDLHARRERSSPRYWITQTDVTFARTTWVHWRCRQCEREYERNMARLGRSQLKDLADPYVIQEAETNGRRRVRRRNINQT
jgi:hypothetical protein